VIHAKPNYGGISIMATKKILIVIDVQNDFITGALRNEEAIKALPNIVNLLKAEKYDEIHVTMDTHEKDYLNTLEGQKLPVEHCIEGTWGWHMPDEVSKTKAIQDAEIYEKPTFGSTWMVNHLAATLKWNGITTFETDYEFTIVGFCTDICVVSNALMLRAHFPNSKITVRKDCVAGVTPKSNEAALLTMQMCQIEVI
jgi:nicotinamidase-related amidase